MISASVVLKTCWARRAPGTGYSSENETYSNALLEEANLILLPRLYRARAGYKGAEADYNGLLLTDNRLQTLECEVGGIGTRYQIRLPLHIQSPSHLRVTCLSHLLNSKLIELSVPEKPQSKNQQYRLTHTGRQLLTAGN